MKDGIFSLLLLLMVLSSVFSDERIAVETSSAPSYFVGELGAQWQFPSDHLPIGATVDDLHFAMWNILDSRYLSFIEDNGQGLKDSLILLANVPVKENSSLTVREQLIIDHIFEMYHHPTHPRSVIALEEVSDQIINELNRLKPNGMVVLKTGLYGETTRDVFILNTEQMQEGYSFGQQRYETKRGHTISSVVFKESSTGILYVFIQSHVPGDPIFSAPARKELAQFVMEKWGIFSDAVIVVMGDVNRSANYLLKDFEEAAKRSGYEKQPFIYYPISYPTHIDAHRNAAWIDNLFVYLPDHHLSVRVSDDPGELFGSVRSTIDLLNNLIPSVVGKK